MIWGKLALGLLALALTTCVLLSNTVRAQSWGGLYDMNRMLNEPHPFAQANAASPAPPPFTPQPNASRRNIHPAATRHSAPAPAPVTTESSGGKWTNIFSEIRIGLLMHDYGPFSSSEEDGYDRNIELLFSSPDIFAFMWSPRPHLGVSYNSSGDTSQAYGGLTWDWSFWNGWFADLSLGSMVHDGHLVGDKGGKLRKSLGCRILFRESVNFGYRFKKRHAIMAHLDHSSNASLCEKNTPDGTQHGRHDVILNEGLESLGIRYGYTF